ncbi:MAG: hypothetical protein RLY14_2994, partial [Planctomycetota bacterium]
MTLLLGSVLTLTVLPLFVNVPSEVRRHFICVGGRGSNRLDGVRKLRCSLSLRRIRFHPRRTLMLRHVAMNDSNPLSKSSGDFEQPDHPGRGSGAQLPPVSYSLDPITSEPSLPDPSPLEPSHSNPSSDAFKNSTFKKSTLTPAGEPTTKSLPFEKQIEQWIDASSSVEQAELDASQLDS